ncbi:MAG: hypothetical protein ACQER9_01220 [Nanobdellota archaeon]
MKTIMKKTINCISALLFSLPIVFADSLFSDSFGMIEEAFMFLFKIGGFVWLDSLSEQMAATRFALFIIIFAVVYSVLHGGILNGDVFRPSGRADALNEGKGIFKNKKVSGIISFSIAAISVIFIPENLIIEIGNLYSAVFIGLIVALPTIALIFIGLKISEHFNNDEKKWIYHLINFLIAMIAITLISGISKEYGVAISFILPLLTLRKEVKDGN